MLPRRDSKPLDLPALIPMFGGMEKKPRILDREVITMGRARGSDFCLDGNEVSALHCIIYRSADGFRVRDCGSRTGTRVNGQGMKNGLLGNGDVLQIGPFSFEVRIPRNLESTMAVDPTRVEKLKRSRSHLVHLALRLRKKLLTKPAAKNQGQPVATCTLSDSTPHDKRAAELKAKIKQYDQKVNQLEESEKELVEEQEALQKQKRDFEAEMRTREAELTKRAKQLEAEQAKLKSAPAVPAGPSPEQLKELETLAAKKKELEALEKKLKARDKELNDDYKEILKERDQVEKLKQQWEQEQVDARKQIEEQRETISCAEITLNDQKSQLGTMIEQLRNMQAELTSSMQGETAQYQQQVVQLKKELAEARAGKGGGTDDAEVRQLRESLAAAKAEAASLALTLQQTTGLNGEVETLQKDLLAKQSSLEHLVRTLQAENESLRQQTPSSGGDDARLTQLAQENDALRKMADELQERFASSDNAPFAKEQLAAYERENEALRAQLAKAEDAAESGFAPAAVDEIRQENQVLRRLLEEAETDLQRLKSPGAAAPIGGDYDVEQLRNENELLHKLLHEKDKMMDEIQGMAASAGNTEKLQSELKALRKALHEKEELIEDLKKDSEKIAGDPEGYEADLNRFRKELELDRARLNKEIDSLRMRNQELDEATREMEMELSRERAEMARERIRLDRMRDEVKADMERLQREMEVRGSLGSVQKLRDEITSKNGKTSTDRLRTMSKLP